MNDAFRFDIARTYQIHTCRQLVFGRISTVWGCKRRQCRFGAFLSCSVKDEEFAIFVSDRNYRFQLIHHCAVMQESSILYVESTINQIIYVVRVSVPEDVLFSYIKGVINPFIEKLMEPLVHDICNQNQPSEDFKYDWAVDWETVTQGYFMSMKLYDEARRIGKPLPRSKGVLPSMVVLWNYLKGGVDIYSRYLSQIPNPHKQLSLYGRLNLRVLKTCLHNANCTWKVFTYEQKFQSNIPDLKQFRSRMSKVGDFQHEFLFEVIAVLDTYFTKLTPDTALEVIQKRTDTGNSSSSIVRSRGSKGKRGIRRIYDLGEGFDIRSARSAKNHQPTFVVQPTTKTKKGLANKKGKCVVCCICVRKPTFHQTAPTSRSNTKRRRKNPGKDGYKVSTVCKQCSAKATAKSGLAADSELSKAPIFQPVFLCTVPRFDTPEYNNLKKTCFEIHHSDQPYPKLNCCQYSDLRISFPRPSSSRRSTGSGSRESTGSNTSGI